MNHAGSREDLQSRSIQGGPGCPILVQPEIWAGQSWLSLVVVVVCALFVVVVAADPVVRDLARSLGPSVIRALRNMTEFGNSAWSLGAGFMLLGCVAIDQRRPGMLAPDALRDLYSTVMPLVFSVAISGAFASLAKTMIGRVRPSTTLEAGVLDLSFLSFSADWASFPSGHATTAAACAAVLAISCPRPSRACRSIGVVAAVSRAFLGVHWQSDCLAGLALGAAITLILRKAMAHRGHHFRLELKSIVPVVFFAILEKVRAAIGSASRLCAAISHFK
jgi:membrane-associated phospholipid phosphatase